MHTANIQAALFQLSRIEDPLDRIAEVESAACTAAERALVIALMSEGSGVKGCDEGSAMRLAAMARARIVGRITTEDLAAAISPFDVLLRPKSYVAPAAPICATPGPYGVN